MVYGFSDVDKSKFPITTVKRVIVLDIMDTLGEIVGHNHHIFYKSDQQGTPFPDDLNPDKCIACVYAMTGENQFAVIEAAFMTKGTGDKNGLSVFLYTNNNSNFINITGTVIELI